MVSGVYILTPDIFSILKKTKPGQDGEIWLVDAINKLAQKRLCLVKEIENGRFQDTNNKLAYYKTVVDFILEDKAIGKKMRRYMRQKIG